MSSLAHNSVEPLAVQVLGSPRIVVESVQELLARAGLCVCDSPEVVVLIDPGDEDWTALAAVGKPAVVLFEQGLSPAGVVAAVTRGAGALVALDALDPSGLAPLVTQVAGGDILLDRAQRVAVVNALRTHQYVVVSLTHRETDILASVEEGCSVKQTARALGISPKTVENTQRHLFQKLGVRNRSQAVARAHALGLLAGTP